MEEKQPIVIGIAGGSGSGKTTVSRHILAEIGQEQIAYLTHDSYYHDNSHLTWQERAGKNYDHPDSLDTSLMVEQLAALRRNEAVEVPEYDFATHIRLPHTRRLLPAPIVLVEGILIFSEKLLRELMDIRIFIDTAADIRLIRRLERDVRERERTPQAVIKQYLATVRPMYLKFVEPSKRYAHLIMPGDGHNRVALELILSRIRSLLNETETPVNRTEKL